MLSAEKFLCRRGFFYVLFSKIDLQSVFQRNINSNGIAVLIVSICKFSSINNKKYLFLFLQQIPAS